MASLSYLNFDLTFESSTDGYAVRVTDSPAGQAGAPFVFPFNELELENFLLRLGQRSSGTRRADSPEMELSKQFGGRLFDALFDDDVRAALRSSIRASEAQGAGLRIRLRFGNTPELADIPWEYLYDGGANRFLTLSRETPLVRYLDLSRPVEPLQVQAPLRILVMISDPSDYDRLDVEAEWKRLLAATATLRERGLVEIVRQDKATLLELQRMLRDNQFHIFHYIGHGVFDESADDGFLVLEEDNGRGRKVSGQYVGTMLADHRSLRLAVLNSCEGGRSSRSDPFAGAAQSLVQQGLPAVIAMQFEISDDAAAVFAQEFYMALAGGYPVDGALAEGRRAIFATKTNAEWGIPVLFMRAADGRIFDVQVVALPTNPPPMPILHIAEEKSAISTKISTKIARTLLGTTGAFRRLAETMTNTSNTLRGWRRHIPWLKILLSMFVVGFLYNYFVLQPRNAVVQQNRVALSECQLQIHVRSWEEAIARCEYAKMVTFDDPETIQLLEEARLGALDFYYSRGEALLRANDPGSALVALDAVVNLDPTYRQVQELRRQVLRFLTPTTTPIESLRATVLAGNVQTPVSVGTVTPVSLTTADLYSPTPAPTPSLIPAQPEVVATRDIDGIIFVYVPAGEFSMGSNDGASDESPVHTVYVDAFWIGRTEVTNAQYAQCVRSSICTAPENNLWEDLHYANYPVTNVNWFQASTYAEWVGGRLPTEAEWEKASRGTDQRIYPWGNEEPSTNLLNFSENNDGGPTTVGRYPTGASPYGVLDMAGNVWAWVSDWYDKNYYEKSPKYNPTGPDNGIYHVLRGGSWSDDTSSIRSTNRSRLEPTSQNSDVGIRLVSSGF